MPSLLISSVIILTCLFTISQIRAFRRNIAAAKHSGFRYVISPIHFNSTLWIILQESLLPVLSRLPKSWTQQWLPLSLFYRIWHAGYEPFRKIGEDAFLIVSPGGIALWTCDAQFTINIMNRRKDFPKAVDMLSILNLYGPTIVAAEGDEHRLYRSIAITSFNETMHADVWKTSMKEAEKLAEHWARTDGIAANVVDDSARFALHVLSKVLYGREMDWIGEEQIAEGHELNFRRACGDAFKYNDVLFLTPRPILNISPAKHHRAAKLAYKEFSKYLEEMRRETAAELRIKRPAPEDASLRENYVMAGTPNLSTDASSSISPAAVLGNLFVFILAGHETSANLLANALTMLAVKRDYQKTMQDEIDETMTDASLAGAPYTGTLEKLLDGRVGALMNEVLRLYSALPFVLKTTSSPQPITLDGEKRIIPKDTFVLINSSATHRSPKHWPSTCTPSSSTAPLPGEAPPYPLSSFNPDIWLGHKNFEPAPGAFIPFSEGFRGCTGSRFARIEFCAAITFLLKMYSVKLANRYGKEAMGEVTRNMSEGIRFEMSLKQRRPTPLQFVKR